MSESLIRRFNAWIVYCDIFGFSAYVRDKDISAVTKALQTGHLILQSRFSGRTPPVHLKFISDSIFLIFEVESEDARARVLQACFEEMQWLMAEFVKLRLPLRGGIAYGEIHLGENLLIGEAVVRAVRCEALIPAPFILLPRNEMASLEKSEIPTGLKSIPVKGDGLIQGVIILPHPIDGLLYLSKEFSDKHCTWGPYAVGKVWYDAVQYIEGSLV